MAKQKYSIYVHAMHSRIQLIRNKINYEKWMTVQDLVENNNKYFQRAASSIESDHGYLPVGIDWIQTAQMFLMTVDFE